MPSSFQLSERQKPGSARSRVWGLGFRVGFGVYGRVLGLGIRVWGLRFRAGVGVKESP